MSERQIQIWRERIFRAFRQRKQIRKRWDRLQQYYQGNYFPSQSQRDRVCANWIFTAVRQMMTALYYREPTMYFIPESELGNVVAPVMESVERYERQIMGAARQERKALLNALLYGTGVLKHGFSYKYAPAPAFPSPNQEQLQRKSGGLGNVGSDDMELPLGGWTEIDTDIKSGHPWKKSIHPTDIIVDPEALCPEEARWIAHRYRRPLIDVIRDERLDPVARKTVAMFGINEAENLPSEESPARRNQPEDDDQHPTMIWLYEIFNREDQSIILIANNCDRALMYDEYPYYRMPEGPYTFLQFFPRDDSFWAISYADTFSVQVEAMNKLRTQMMDHLERHMAVRGAYLKGTLAKNDVERFTNTASNVLMELSADSSKNVNDAIQIFPYVPIAADTWRLQELFKADFEQIAGLSELSLGSGIATQTATEASYIQQHQLLRESDMRDTFDTFLTESTRKDIQLLQQYWPIEKVTAILGPDGQAWGFVKLTASDVNAAYSVSIQPGSTARIDRNVRIRQTIDAMQHLSTFGPYLERAGWSINWPELFKTFLENTEFARNASRFLIPLSSAGPAAPENAAQQSEIPQEVPPPAAPAAVNNMQQMPTENIPYQSGRVMSETVQG